MHKVAAQRTVEAYLKMGDNKKAYFSGKWA